MNIIYILPLAFVLGGISIVYNNKFLLSILISLEFLLLNTIIFNIYAGILNNDYSYPHLSIFILALSAVEASIGISLVALLSRNLIEVTLSKLNTLKT
uniref:NADH dehydrogenase subunit 4L n=1 Tax=Ophiothrix exigua TaxID=1815227 RepID=UPI00286A7434|nr:NADH dehydrogenase subunit 4L [Ophiothrix exigua]WKW95556.1 NADH dehydrogenase subunit 4L [Ophiothrix exigua]